MRLATFSQFKMLGLAGTYTQILDENRPIMRGLSAPYGLSYTPGMWLNSIMSLDTSVLSVEQSVSRLLELIIPKVEIKH